MGIIIGMFTQLARLGVTRAAAFFYAVAVGVVANVVIAHFSPHPGDAPADAQPAVVKSDTPVATALIAPKPTQTPVQTLDISAPAITARPTPASPLPAPPATAPAATATAVSAPAPPNPLPPDASVSASLPSPSAMTPPPLKPAAMPSTPVAAAGTPDNKPAVNVEASASAVSSAPIPLLPQTDQPGSDQQATKPANPGPGSGGLY
jgi:hypothetical protein